jgi:hypothetical protein
LTSGNVLSRLDLPRTPPGACHRGGPSPWTGLTLRPRQCHRISVPSCVVLTGRAPDVPYASVPSGHPRTTTVDVHGRRAVGSAHPELADGASQARGSSSSWSVLGPHGVGNRWSSAGTSGQRRRISIAGQRPFTVSTSAGEAARRWVRIPPPPPCSCAVFAGQSKCRLVSERRW